MERPPSANPSSKRQRTKLPHPALDTLHPTLSTSIRELHSLEDQVNFLIDRRKQKMKKIPAKRAKEEIEQARAAAEIAMMKAMAAYNTALETARRAQEAARRAGLKHTLKMPNLRAPKALPPPTPYTWTMTLTPKWEDPCGEAHTPRGAAMRGLSWSIRHGGYKDFKILLRLLPMRKPQRFLPTKAFGFAFGVEGWITLEQAQDALWDYIRTFRLQDPLDWKQVHCDERLQQLFGQDLMHMKDMHARLQKLLIPEAPKEFEYNMVMRPGSHPPTIYEVDVELDDPEPLHGKVEAAGFSVDEKMRLLEAKQLDLNDRLRHSVLRRMFYEAMAKDPVETLQQWVISQQRDAQLVGKASTALTQRMDESSMYCQPWVPEAVELVVQKHKREEGKA